MKNLSTEKGNEHINLMYAFIGAAATCKKDNAQKKKTRKRRQLYV